MKFLLGVLFAMSFVCCSHDNTNNTIKDSKELFELKYSQEDAKSLAIILSSRAKNFNEVTRVLEQNNIYFEYEIIENVEFYPVLLNNYRIIFSKDGFITNVEYFKN